MQQIAKNYSLLIGVMLVILWQLALEIICYLQGHRIIPGWVFWGLLVLPIAGAFITAYYSTENRVERAVSLAVFIAVIMPSLDLLGQEFGITSDFPGVAGVKYNLLGAFGLGLFTSTAGLFIAWLLKQ